MSDPKNNNIQSNRGKGLRQLGMSLSAKPKSLPHAMLFPAMAFGATAAQASIVTWSIPVTVGDGLNSLWNIDQTGAAEVSLNDSNGSADAFTLSWDSQQPGFGRLVDGGCGVEMMPVTPTTIIGSGGSFGAGLCNPTNNASGSSDFNGFLDYGFSTPDWSGVFGFQFDNAGTTNYGVASFTFSNWDGNAPVGTFTITEWSYNDNGESILGDGTAVPEPAATGALMGVVAMGAMGLRRWRKQTAHLN